MKLSITSLVFLCLITTVFGSVVSIRSIIPSQAHVCINYCALAGVYLDSLPNVLGCADPFDNECYCPTESASISKASAGMQKCVSNRCASGDLTRDLFSLKSIYAGYCKDSGFSQDAAVLGYTATPEANPTPSSKPSSSPSASASASPSATPSTAPKSDGSSQPSKTAGEQTDIPTTTQKTVVTQTQTKTGGVDSTRSQVVIQETETVFVDPNGADSNSGGGMSTAAKIGVGVAVPLIVILLAGSIGILIWRKRRGSRPTAVDSTVGQEHRHDIDGIEKEVGNKPAFETRTVRAAELGSNMMQPGLVAHEVHGQYYQPELPAHGTTGDCVVELPGTHLRP